MLRDHEPPVIPDTHLRLPGGSVGSVLFEVAGRPVSSYAFFVAVGFIVAITLYYLNTRGRGVGRNGLYIALAAAAGGIVGAKLPISIASIPAFIRDQRPELLLSGRTILGGLIGGAFAVWLTKRRLGITQRLGNQMVPSICLGIFFGRIGCVLGGCCYGTPTSLPWGFDFGDHVARHPTQLYEALLVLALFAYAQVMKDRYEPGVLFRRFMLVYFGWRFLVEFIRVNPPALLGLTYYQVTAILVMSYYLIRGVTGEGVMRERDAT